MFDGDGRIEIKITQNLIVVTSWQGKKKDLKRGEKHPAGPALKLLSLVEKKGLNAIN